MFKKIMVPVDLAHADTLDRALGCAGDLAKQYGSPITYVGVTSALPSKLAHNPKEFEQKLEEFVKKEVDSRGVDGTAHVEIAHDPTTDVDDVLLKAIDEVGADLVVMASHAPGAMEYIWPSNGGKLAEHAKCSIMLIRP